MVSGVWAGNPDQLSIRHAFPKVWNLEAKYGSLIRGAMALKRERRQSKAVKYQSSMCSFRGGLEGLTRTLAKEVGEHLHLGVNILESGPEKVRWEMDGKVFEAQAEEVICTMPAHRWRHLPWRADLAGDIDALETPPTVPVSTLSLAFRRTAVPHPLDGFGMLIPESEGQPVLGSLFMSSLFPDHTPAGEVLLTSFIGGALHPERAEWSSDRAEDETRNCLRDLLGVGEAPLYRKFHYWPKAIPQYTTRHAEFLESLRDLESKFQGLSFLSPDHGGPGLNDRVQAALDFASRKAG